MLADKVASTTIVNAQRMTGDLMHTCVVIFNDLVFPAPSKLSLQQTPPPTYTMSESEKMRIALSRHFVDSGEKERSVTLSSTWVDAHSTDSIDKAHEYITCTTG